MLNEELSLVKSTNESLSKQLEDFHNQNKVQKKTHSYFICWTSYNDYLIPKKCSSSSEQILSGKLEEMENEVSSEKKNALKRDKTIQGLTQVLGEKEKEVK